MAATLVAAGLGAVKTELFPASNSSFARFNLQMPTGTALSGMNQVATDVENRMRKDARVLNVGSLVGSSGPVGGTQVTNVASLSVTLAPNIIGNQAQRFVTQWTAALTGSRSASSRGHGTTSFTPEQIQQLRARFGNPIPGLQVFGRTVDIVQNIIARGQDALQIQIFGPDINKLYDIAEFTAIPKLQSAIPGLQPPQPGITTAQPEIDVSVDRATAAQLGVSTQTISQVVDIATAGQTASFMQINGTQYPIEVQLPANQRRSLQAIAEPDGSRFDRRERSRRQHGGFGRSDRGRHERQPLAQHGLGADRHLHPADDAALGTGEDYVRRRTFRDHASEQTA